MIPIKFKEQNFELKKPKNMTDEQCCSLPCFKDGKVIVSKWELTEEEKEHILEHGYLWLMVHSTNTQPPVSLLAAETVFDKE